ncbi:MAG: rhodanese-like domain-containing protein [Spirochaetales bacterium]|nr:rhodanese-like domain-containing protein [Spirochaetales bacterium]
MNIKMKIILSLLLYISVQSIFGSGKPEIKESEDMNSNGTVSVSGFMENGLRVLSANIDKKELTYTVYRGDYIVFKTSEGLSHRLIIPSLDIDKQIPVPENEKPYIKMKESGVLEFSIDELKGFIKVIDFQGPRYWEVTSKEGADLIKNINPFILDVRTEGEYQQGHLENSFLLPVQVLEDEIGLIEKYKDQDIFIYCRSGNRSTVASKILLDAGFTTVYNLRYGISGWTAEGYPVVVE